MSTNEEKRHFSVSDPPPPTSFLPSQSDHNSSSSNCPSTTLATTLTLTDDDVQPFTNPSTSSDDYSPILPPQSVLLVPTSQSALPTTSSGAGDDFLRASTDSNFSVNDDAVFQSSRHQNHEQNIFVTSSSMKTTTTTTTSKTTTTTSKTTTQCYGQKEKVEYADRDSLISPLPSFRKQERVEEDSDFEEPLLATLPSTSLLNPLTTTSSPVTFFTPLTTPSATPLMSALSSTSPALFFTPLTTPLRTPSTSSSATFFTPTSGIMISCCESPLLPLHSPLAVAAVAAANLPTFFDFSPLSTSTSDKLKKQQQQQIQQQQQQQQQYQQQQHQTQQSFCSNNLAIPPTSPSIILQPLKPRRSQSTSQHSSSSSSTTEMTMMTTGMTIAPTIPSTVNIFHEAVEPPPFFASSFQRPNKAVDAIFNDFDGEFPRSAPPNLDGSHSTTTSKGLSSDESSIQPRQDNGGGESGGVQDNGDVDSGSRGGEDGEIRSEGSKDQTGDQIEKLVLKEKHEDSSNSIITSSGPQQSPHPSSSSPTSSSCASFVLPTTTSHSPSSSTGSGPPSAFSLPATHTGGAAAAPHSGGSPSSSSSSSSSTNTISAPPKQGHSLSRVQETSFSFYSSVASGPVIDSSSCVGVGVKTLDICVNEDVASSVNSHGSNVIINDATEAGSGQTTHEWLRERIAESRKRNVLNRERRLSLEGCLDEVSKAPLNGSSTPQVSTTAAASSTPSLILLDCRSQSDYQKGHIQGAINVTLPTLMQKRLRRGALSVPSIFATTDLKDKLLPPCCTSEEASLRQDIVIYDDFSAAIADSSTTTSAANISFPTFNYPTDNDAPRVPPLSIPSLSYIPTASSSSSPSSIPGIPALTLSSPSSSHKRSNPPPLLGLSLPPPDEDFGKHSVRERGFSLPGIRTHDPPNHSSLSSKTENQKSVSDCFPIDPSSNVTSSTISSGSSEDPPLPHPPPSPCLPPLTLTLPPTVNEIPAAFAAMSNAASSIDATNAAPSLAAKTAPMALSMTPPAYSPLTASHLASPSSSLGASPKFSCSLPGSPSMAGSHLKTDPSDRIGHLLTKKFLSDGYAAHYLEGGYLDFETKFPELCDGIKDNDNRDGSKSPVIGLSNLRISCRRTTPPRSHLRSKTSVSSDASGGGGENGDKEGNGEVGEKGNPTDVNGRRLSNEIDIDKRHLPTESPIPDSKAMSDFYVSRTVVFPVQILPGLFLGNGANSTDLTVLNKHSIKYIVNVTPNLPNAFEGSEKEIKYMQIPITDHWSQNLSCFFPKAFGFIDEGRDNAHGVLVHCLAGVSRSVTVTVAYLMYKSRLSLNDAYDHVRACKPNISPNFNFMGQLLEFEKTLGIHGDDDKDDSKENRKIFTSSPSFTSLEISDKRVADVPGLTIAGGNHISNSNNVTPSCLSALSSCSSVSGPPDFSISGSSSGISGCSSSSSKSGRSTASSLFFSSPSVQSSIEENVQDD